MKECTESEFNAFIAGKSYNTTVVKAGSAELEIYFTEEEYNPRYKEAYRSLNLAPPKFWIK